MHRIIVKDNLVFEARTMEPDEALFLAKANGFLTAEAFTLKYANSTLSCDGSGKIIRNLTQEKCNATKATVN